MEQPPSILGGMDNTMRQKLVRSLVRVQAGPKSWGMGFLTSRDKIITAAHCIPPIPEGCALYLGDDLGVYIREIGRRKLLVSVLDSYDPCHDVAVLRPCYAESMDSIFFDETRQVEVFAGEFSEDENVRLHIFTHENKWVSGEARIINPNAPGLTVLFPPRTIKGGTSGSPAFNDRGQAVGIVSQSSETTDPQHVMLSFLANSLPRYLLR